MPPLVASLKAPLWGARMIAARRCNVESARDRDLHPWRTRLREQRRFRGLARRGGVGTPATAAAAVWPVWRSGDAEASPRRLTVWARHATAWRIRKNRRCILRRIFYRIEGTDIYVVRILHSLRNHMKALFGEE